MTASKLSSFTGKLIRYKPKQQMNNEELKFKMEELDIPAEKIEELLLSQKTKALLVNEKLNSDLTKVLEKHLLENEIAREPGWKRKASLQAKLISLDLE